MFADSLVCMCGMHRNLQTMMLKICSFGQVQGFVNTLADLRGMLAAVERINTVICSAEVDEWLAHGLEREARGELQSSDECANISDTGDAASINNSATIPIMSEFQKSVCELAWSGDVVLESK